MEATTQKKFALATGRRKEATARVRVISGGKGLIFINGRKLEDYFPTINCPLESTAGSFATVFFSLFSTRVTC